MGGEERGHRVNTDTLLYLARTRLGHWLLPRTVEKAEDVGGEKRRPRTAGSSTTQVSVLKSELAARGGL